MRGSGIYKIQSKVKPERIYIGSAINVKHRWENHLYYLRRNKHNSTKLQRHYNKYGESDLQFSVLIGCEKEDLIKTEQFFIDTYKPFFNTRPIAESNLGVKFTEEHKRKMSESSKGEKLSNEAKVKISRALREYFAKNEEARLRQGNHLRGKPGLRKGAVISEEAHRRISESNKGKKAWNLGKKASPEAIKNQSKAHIGQPSWNKGLKAKNPPWNKGLKGVVTWKMSDEAKQKISLAAKGNKRSLGYKHTEEAKQRMREKALGRKMSAEAIEKLRQRSMGNKNMSGKPRSEETKRKVSEGLKRYFASKRNSDRF